MPLTDREIEELTLAERLALVHRLRHGEVVDAVRAPVVRKARRGRAVALTVTAVATALLVPWTAYLALSLPEHYESHAWRLTWVGFDVLLMVLLGLTAFFAWRKRMLVVLTSFAAGVLLLADAWFDVTTADRDSVHLSVASAIVVEIPLAIFLMGMAIGISWRVARLLNALTGDGPTGRWRMPINAQVMSEGDDRHGPRQGVDITNGK
ncbi:hypothetical protein [Flexivirga oryzae]|uniref:MFS family permease n=1 Tax=Flexivirga oryzae TaxID=1794944 RepID=A0A839N5M1_9MICO|nr:hypothetical protein [Flexivirga oryzae]MBB2893048.1 MFS family permease [Flexivirga oryzae]